MYATKLHSTTKYTVISGKWSELCSHINQKNSNVCMHVNISMNGM